MKSAVALTLWALLFINVSVQASQKLMDPQITSAPGFEGWYTKIDTKSRSIVLIVGTKFRRYANSPSSLGMVTLITREGTNPAKQYNYFTEDVSVGAPTDRYLWKTNDHSILFSSDEINVNHPNFPRFKVHISKHKPWKQGSPFGPEGLMAHNPILYSHWFVFSMDSNAELTLYQEDKKTREFGFAHLEKNWGEGFPDSWVWSQGRSHDNTTSFAFAGGRAPTRIGLPLNVWALSIKDHGNEFIFSPMISKLNAKITTDCKSFYHFESQNLREKVSLRIASDPNDFLPIYGVKDQDWEQVAKESFHSKADLKLYRHGKLKIAKTIPFTAMEFGGNCKPNAREAS